jgi:hypothetical protein
MTTPIYIPIPNIKKIEKIPQYLSKTYPPSPTNSPKSLLSVKRVVLYGTPFKNKDTMKMLLQDCVEELNEDDIKQIVEDANYKNKEGVTVIRTCDERKAFKYCQNLVENGLDASIE